MGYIKCRGLSKMYSNQTIGLHDVSFEVPSTGIFSLIGRNGAGKTTLIRILATQLMPSRGTVEINGIDVIKEPNLLREKIAIIPQEARAIPWLTPAQTIQSYLLYRGFSHAEASRRTKEALKKLDLEKIARKLNRTLSGGQKRKVLVATVVASEAEILFLDEPTTGLDPISRQDLWNILDELKQDRFIFLTTHYLEEAERLADRIGILDDGELKAIGTLDELRSKFTRKFSIRILENDFPLEMITGEKIKGQNHFTQIIATEDEAYDIARNLIEKRVKFSSNPISLEDIFYYIVRKPIEVGSDGTQ